MEDFAKSYQSADVTETHQGLAHARNRAVEEFRGDILLFTDDDIRFGPGWVAAYRDAIRRFPDADYFGGRILPDWGDAKPRWIGDEPLPLIDGVLGWFDHGARDPAVRDDGASAIWRKFRYQAAPVRKDWAVPHRSGHWRKGLGRGEETEFLLRARDAGAQGVYVGEALCFHAYDPRRLTLAALYRYGIACGRSHNAIADDRIAVAMPRRHGSS